MAVVRAYNSPTLDGAEVNVLRLDGDAKHDFENKQRGIGMREK